MSSTTRLIRVLFAAAFGAVSVVAIVALIVQSRGGASPSPDSAGPGTAASPSPPVPAPGPAAVIADGPRPEPVPSDPANGTAGRPRHAPENAAATRARESRPAQPARAIGKHAAVTKSAADEHPAAEKAAPKPAAPKQAAPKQAAARPFGAGSITRSHYLRHLTGGPVDRTRMRALGASDARHNRSGQPHVVLLDIGGQTGAGVLLSTTTRWVSYSDLADAVTAYAQGYHEHQRPRAPVTIAIGTNNDLAVSYSSGRQWATQVVQPVVAATRHFAKMTIAGADDIEPGFAAGPRPTRAWIRGFLSATRAPLVFNGSADGCSPTHPDSRCHRGWTARDLAWVAGVAAPKRISALPQIYNPTMAHQWAMISLTAVRDGHRPLRFHGPLTENAACQGVKDCPTMNSADAWRALWHSLRTRPAIAPKMLPTRSDLDVH